MFAPQIYVFDSRCFLYICIYLTFERTRSVIGDSTQ